MNYLHRLIESLLKEVLQHFPVVAVTGARQVGKSTLVEAICGDQFKTFVFDPVEDVGLANSDPDLFLRNNPGSLFLDEIQYAPNLLNSLKRSVDKDRSPGRFIISGSQNLSLVKNVSESLAGRVAILDLLPLGYSELTDRNDSPGYIKRLLSGSIIDQTTDRDPGDTWFRTIWRGGYPGLLELPDNMVPIHFKSYFRTYIERDIRTVGNIGDLQLFSRFFKLLSAMSGREINPAQLGRDLGIDRKTAISWKSIAELTFQWIEVPAFTRNAIKRVSGKHKGIFTDTGLICNLQRITSPDAVAGHPMQGQLVESWVIMEIFKQAFSLSIQPDFYHFRSHGGAEVDLIIEMNGKLIPIEIKTKSHPSKRDTTGINAFRKSFPNENIEMGFLICAVDKPLWITEDILAIPWWSL